MIDIKVRLEDQPKTEPEKIKPAEAYPILTTHWPDFQGGKGVSYGT